MGCSNSQPPNPSSSTVNNNNTIIHTPTTTTTTSTPASTALSTYQHHRQQRPKRSMKLSKHKTPLPPIYEDNSFNNNLSATHQSFSYIHHKQHVHNTIIPITSTHNNNNSTICTTTSACQSSHTQSFSKRISQSDIRRSECNGVVIVENVRKHLPKDINEDMIYELVANSLEGSIVDEKSNTTDKQGNKMVTHEQVKAIAEVVYDKLVNGDNNNNNNTRRKKHSSIINGLNVRVGIRKLTPSLLKKTCFKGQNVTKMQIDNALKNISQGEDNVRILTVEIN